MNPPTAKSAITPTATVGPDVQAVIGQKLRATYHEILNEPVPDRFVRLLQELAQKKPPQS